MRLCYFDDHNCWFVSGASCTVNNVAINLDEKTYFIFVSVLLRQFFQIQISEHVNMLLSENEDDNFFSIQLGNYKISLFT
jgi:hypothetical protein